MKQAIWNSRKTKSSSIEAGVLTSTLSIVYQHCDWEEIIGGTFMVYFTVNLDLDNFSTNILLLEGTWYAYL